MGEEYTLYSTFPESSTSAARAGVLAPLPSHGEEVLRVSSWNNVSMLSNRPVLSFKG